MASIDTSVAGGLGELLKVLVPGKVEEQLFRETPAVDLFERGSDSIELGGEEIQVRVKLGDSSGILASTTTTTGQDLPDEAPGAYDRMTIPYRRHIGTIGIPYEVLYRSEGNDKAQISFLQAEIQGIKDKFRELLNRELHGDGTGTLATVSSFANGAPDTVTVDNTRRLSEGMVVDFIRSGAEVADAVDVSISQVLGATTFYVTITGTPASADIIVMANSYNKATLGLAHFTALTGTVQGIANRQNYRFLKSNLTQNNGGSGNAALSLIKLRIALTQHQTERGKKPDYAICQPDILDAYAHLLRGDIRYRQTDVQRPWASGADFQPGCEIITDPDATANQIIFVTKQDIGRGGTKEVVTPSGGKRESGLFKPLVIGGQHWRTKINSSTSKYQDVGQASYVSHFTLYGRRFNGLTVLTEVNGLSDGGYATMGGLA